MDTLDTPDSADANEADPARPPWADYAAFSDDTSSSADSTSSGSCVASDNENLNYEEDTEMESLFKEKPLEMLERLRTLTTQRVHRGINDELCRVTNPFARLAWEYTDISSEKSSQLVSREYRKRWDHVLRLGLLDLLEEVVQEDSLFDENPVSELGRLSPLTRLV